MTVEEHRPQGIVPASIIAALVTFGGFLVLAMANNAWVFEYPLDDVYIHLAVAEEITNGGYGVNAGERASAASSPLYPYLLTPFAGTGAQRWLPLIWNTGFLVAAATLLATALTEADLGRAGFWLVLAAPAALSLYGTAYAGMENMGHTAASLAILLGLWRFAQSGQIGWLLILGIVLAPALRIEGLAFSLAAGGVVILLGRPGAGMALMGLAVLPVILFVAMLLSFGLEASPNSIVAKLSDQGTGGSGLLTRASNNLANNSVTYGGRYLLALAVMVAIVAIGTFLKDRRAGYVGFAVAAAAFAHLAFGSVGWLDRYENYAVVTAFAVLPLLLRPASAFIKTGVLTVALVGGFLTYGPFVRNNIDNMQAIHLQHAQMARFAKDHLGEPIAVNDLGYVAWQNPDYVLDLWGLASKEALEDRLTSGNELWANSLTEDKKVSFAMVYRDWLGDNLGPDWTPLGVLAIGTPNIAFLGGPEVTFYARNSSDIAAYQEKIADWSRDLPAGAVFLPGVPG